MGTRKLPKAQRRYLIDSAAKREFCWAQCGRYEEVKDYFRLPYCSPCYFGRPSDEALIAKARTKREIL